MPEETASGTVIGVSRPLPAWRSGVTGRTRYAADEAIPGLLHARLVLSPYAHAEIVSIDATAALEVPGVVAVLTAADLDTTSAGDMRMFRPLAEGEACFAGHPVAMVVASSEAVAADGASLVRTDLRPLPEVLDPESAMRPDSPLARPRVKEGADSSMSSLHAAVGGSGDRFDDDDPPLSANVSDRVRHRHGDVEAALAASAVRRRAGFRTGWVYQAYLEPQVATAIPTAEGDLDVRTSTQGIEFVRSKLSRVLGLAPGRITVSGTPIGGGFGGKLLIVEPLVAAAARRLGRPVRLALTRSEDMAMTNPVQGGVIDAEIGVTAGGRLSALRARLVFDAGAFAEWSTHGVAAVLIGGTYRWDAYDIEAFSVETNHVGTGSYRGPGAPPASFAIESLIDEVAADVGMDAVEIRRRSNVATGDSMVDGVAWPVIGANECLERLAEHPLWTGRDELPDGEGVGLAMGVWPGGKDRASAVCRLESDGSLSVITGMVDMAGTSGSLTAIAADTFGLSPDAIRIRSVSTDAALHTPLSGGSTITYSIGRAVQAAAAEARRRLLDYAAERLEIAPSDLEIVDGKVVPRGAPSRAVSVAELAASYEDDPGGAEPIEGHGPVDTPPLAPSVAGHLVHVGVDATTGTVRLLDHVVAQDVGHALNPALVEGQMRGGAVQALGWALTEELVFGDGGELLTGSFLDYTVPRATMVPQVETLIVEVPTPEGPYGARGVGEAGVCAGAAAVANAVAAATGVRQRRLPMTPERVWRSVAQASGA